MLPAVIAAALVIMLVLQFAIPRRLDLPETGVIQPFRLDPLIAGGVRADPVIVSRALFNADRSAVAAAAGAAKPAAPLDGASAVGLLSRRGAVAAFIRGADGALVTLRIGSLYHGWAFVGGASTGLTFRRGSEQVRLPFGTAAAAAAPVEGAAPPVPEPSPAGAR